MHLLALRTGLLQFKYIPSNSRYWYSSLTFLLWYLNTSLSNALVMLDTVVELTALLPHKGSSASSTFLVDIPCKNMFFTILSTSFFLFLDFSFFFKFFFPFFFLFSFFFFFF